MPDNSTSPDLEALREDLAKFMREIIYENYMYNSGQKETLDISSIYERYGHLASKDLAKNFLERWKSVQTEEDKRSARHFHQFALFGYLGNLLKGIQEEMARVQSGMSITVDGDEIGYHSILPRLRNEPDKDKRREIDDKASELELELASMEKDAWQMTFDVFRDFGFESYFEGCKFALQVDYEWLAGELRKFLDDTDEEFLREFNSLSEKVLGYSIDDARKCDVPFLLRGGDWDGLFPKDGMVDKVKRFFADMGLPIDSIPAIRLDVEERPKKRPRAFCSAVRPGEEIYVCLRQMGGMNDYHTFMHELGHAYHFAHTDASLPSELILIGDSATSEIYAFMFQYLGVNPVWLKEYIGIENPSELVEFQRLLKLYFLRRYASKFLYEIDLLSSYNINGRESLYPKYLDRGLKVKHRDENWLSDLDPAFYSAGYLRAWIFEVQLRDYLKGEYGETWWTNPASGDKLKEFWRTGRMYKPEELAEKVLGQKLDLGPIIREVTKA